ncbi:YciI family protein [Actinomycetospora chlora]|uniref:YciI family protein n=1 Tax=Actinomycetospora chlora TaxID=663608 RepID=A0ABP9BPI2_9PSEU
MHYLLGVRIDENDLPYSDEEMAASFARVGAVNDQMKAAGIWVFGGGLQPSDSATVVRVEHGRTEMTDGPFAETKEQLGGFYVIEVDDLDAALAWSERLAEACRVPIEVRPFEGIA